jgi:hypothetical protein
MLQRPCLALAQTRPEFSGLTFTAHDFRRVFTTELVNNGLPIHIGAAMLGHTSLQTTRGYVAVFNEDLVRHYQAFLDRRRQLRPADEYRQPTDAEWTEFEDHFVLCTLSSRACRRGPELAGELMVTLWRARLACRGQWARCGPAAGSGPVSGGGRRG